MVIEHPETCEPISVNVHYRYKDIGVMMRANENMQCVIERVELSDDPSRQIDLDSLSDWERARIQRSIEADWRHENEMARETWRGAENGEDL